MVTFQGLPLFRVTLASEGDGVLRVSLVDEPAVGSNFEYFAKQMDREPVLYAVQDEDRRIVRGVMLRADFPIFRRDTPDGPGYYVTFGKEVIRQIAERYLTEGHANDVNLQHEDGSDVDGVQMVQLFIKDTAAGINPEGFDVADGSLFAEYHVTNDDVWAEIKAGTFKGFSVEILYTLIPAGDMMSRQDEGDDMVSILLQLINKVTNMSKLKQLRAALARVIAEFGSITTDKAVLHWDGDEDLKAGDRVYVEDAEGNRTGAEDGDYVTPDNKTIVVVDGAVSEIRDPEAEVAPQEDPANEGEEAPEQMARQRASKFEESYDEKMRKILDAIRAFRGNREDDYGYLVSAGDDFGVYAHYGEDTNWEDRFVRYAIAWDEEGNATASNPVECRMAFVPMDFDDSAAFTAPAAEERPTEEEFERAVKAAEDFRKEADTLKARIAELEKTPAGKSVRESYNAKDGNALPVSTGDKGLDRLASRFNKR